MFVFLVAYRARGVQTFRREQIMNMTKSIKTYFGKHNVPYKIVIIEQNDNSRFNRGKLLNVAFLESELRLQGSRTYVHFNVDYEFNQDFPFPEDLLNFTSGIIDLHRPNYPVLGAACIFDSHTYKKIGGFPNDLYGWGGDDWAIYNRIVNAGVVIQTPKHLFNSGLVIEHTVTFNNDFSQNNKNMILAKRNDSTTNGLLTCNYHVDKHGEFHDGNTVIHYLVNIYSINA
jgi:hypothetical protein